MHVYAGSSSPRNHSGSGLIAWLSVCLLAAAFGQNLDPAWQPIWAEAGAFGLAAALGLGSLERLRQKHRGDLRHQAILAQASGCLAHIGPHGTTLEAIHAAVRKLAEQAVINRHRDPGKSGRFSQRACVLLRDYPFRLTAIEMDSPKSHAPDTPGRLRQISSRSISFEHTAPLCSSLATLTFELGDSEWLALVVDVAWTQRSGDGYASAGTVLAVGTPVSAECATV